MGVGLVVVSHSRALADAAVALASEMLHGSDARIAVAAGLDETAFGTDATAIEAAIREVDDPTGVVVLMDLGSAVLSAELALEFLEPEVANRVILCPAPLVEGLVVAAVAAAGGASREEVAAEARDALAGKLSQLGGAPSPAPAATEPEPQAEPGGVRAMIDITIPHGLHARPAAKLVQAIRGVDATVTVRNVTLDGAAVPASSLSKVATLGALAGHTIEVLAHGPQAQESVDALVALAGRDWDEELAAPTGAPEPAGPAVEPARGTGDVRPELQAGLGFPASPGVAIGPARLIHEPELVLPGSPAGTPVEEEQSLDAALSAVRAEITSGRAQVARDVSESEAEIFDAHLMMLDDPEVITEAHDRIRSGAPAAAAYAEAIGAAERSMAELDDPYLRARAADVRAVGDQVLRRLVGVGDAVVPTDGVIVADDLTPAQVAAVDPASVLGIALAGASPTSHAAILARSRGVPMIVGGGPSLRGVADGTMIAIDGSTGEVVLDPAPDVVERLSAKRRAERAAYEAALASAATPAATADGVRVLVGVNGATPSEIAAGVRNGAEIVGLVRTEFLFLGRESAPDLDEQVAAYRALAEAADGRRLTLRTLDVGGDKPLPYVPQPEEANPFLGVRGLRLALAHPDLLAVQLQAIVTVAHEAPVSVMFPMVSTLEEMRLARRALDAAIAEVGPHPPAGLQFGVMVEVPALALKAAAVAPYVDFFSIGTNDLTQYALAAERGNDAVATVGDPLDPGVLQLIARVGAAGGPDCLVAVCGELAADPEAAPLLVGLGVRELSVSAAAVPLVKAAVRSTSAAAMAPIVEACLAAPDAGVVRALLAG